MWCENNQLNCLNVKNGNNNNIQSFKAQNNPSLTGIEVDNIAYSTTNWSSIDPQTSFSTSCITHCAVGIEENNLSNLSLYPNPTNGIITIDLGGVKQDIKVTLTNNLGQVIITEYYISTNFINFDINTPNGIYFLQIKVEGESKTIKVSKN